MDGGSKTFRSEYTSDPALCDVAPTVLRIMGVDQPEAMTGVSLVD